MMLSELSLFPRTCRREAHYMDRRSLCVAHSCFCLGVWKVSAVNSRNFYLKILSELAMFSPIWMGDF